MANITDDPDKIIKFEDNIKAWIDSDTELMWEIKTEENLKHRYVWSEKEIEWALLPYFLTDDVEDAFSYAEKLNKMEYAGYNDWRVPSIEELKTILTKEKNGQYHTKIKLPLCENIFDEYWSSSTSGNKNTMAFYLKPFLGFRSDNLKTVSYSVRCVRLQYAGHETHRLDLIVLKQSDSEIGTFANIVSDIDSFLAKEPEMNISTAASLGYARQISIAGLSLQGAIDKETYTQQVLITHQLLEDIETTGELHIEAYDKAILYLRTYSPSLTTNVCLQIMQTVSDPNVVSAYDMDTFHSFDKLLNIFER